MPNFTSPWCKYENGSFGLSVDDGRVDIRVRQVTVGQYGVKVFRKENGENVSRELAPSSKINTLFKALLDAHGWVRDLGWLPPRRTAIEAIDEQLRTALFAAEALSEQARVFQHKGQVEDAMRYTHEATLAYAEASGLKRALDILAMDKLTESRSA